MFFHEIARQGKMTEYISMAEAIAARSCDIVKEITRESFADFHGFEHRLEPVISVGGIQFINDSKATNVNAVWYALETAPGSVILIMGGVDKGNDYRHIFGLVKKKVSAIICLGVDNRKLFKAFKNLVPSIVETKSMIQAVSMAYQLAKNVKVKTVMLSPACASFDLFENYEDRGWQFKKAVRQL